MVLPLKNYRFIKINYRKLFIQLPFSILLIVSAPALAQLNADFTASVTLGCSPLRINFYDRSVGSPTSWFWDFGNGFTSTDQNPVMLYNASGSFTVRLIVKNANEEDLEEKTAYIKVNQTPAAGFTNTIASGCAPLNISFTDTTNLSGVTLKSRTWNFGDGTTSSQPSPTHIYTANGNFAVSLTVETTNGCISTFTKAKVVSIGTKPAADFIALPLDGCASEQRQFTNTTTGSFNYTQWSFFDGTTSSEVSPLHHFEDTGWFNIRLIVADNGCRDTAIKNKYIHVKGPVANIRKTADCSNKNSFTFLSRSSAPIYEWDLGDGTTNNLKTVTHPYSKPGLYSIKLKVDNGTCFDTASTLIYIASSTPGAAVVPPQNTYCRNNFLDFEITNLDPGGGSLVKWDFGNGDSLKFNAKNVSALYAYNANGNYRPVAYLKDFNGCFDTISLKPVTIAGPTADFSNLANGCSSAAVPFTDNSVPDGAPINNWQWSYGDGTIETSQKPFTHTYTFPGLYNVNLKVTDGNGCTDTITNQINIVSSPDLQALNDTALCVGQSITLTATGASTLAWEANGSVICNPCTVPPVVSPSLNTTYYVRGSNVAGCSVVDSTIISVQPRTPVFAQPSNTIICAGSLVQLNATGATKYSWSPAEGLSSTVLPNPIAVPMVSTTYKVVSADNNACPADSATVNITVNQLPTVDIPNLDVRLPLGSTYQLQPVTSADVQKWQWSPPTGLSCYNCPDPVATINNPITYVLTVYNSNGCSSKDSINILPVCTNDIIFVPNTFSPNNDGMNDYFFPNSKILLTVKSMIIFNRWGQKVFERKNFQTNNAGYGWNGKVNNKDVDAGVYIYVMQLECSDGSVMNLKGNVSLLQ